jgi:hypothetical protein
MLLTVMMEVQKNPPTEFVSGVKAIAYPSGKKKNAETGYHQTNLAHLNRMETRVMSEKLRGGVQRDEMAVKVSSWFGRHIAQLVQPQLVGQFVLE